MSEKATLLTSIPPVAKSTSLLNTTSTGQVDGDAVEGVAVGTAALSEPNQSIAAFQGAIYASFVLTFCLAGFAAVVLLRKASKVAEQRFVVGAKALAVASGIIALHGFFTTYLYANYLNGEGAVPLLVMISVWVFIGPAIAVLLNYLLTPGSSPQKSAIFFDGCAYFAIFTCAGFSLLHSIEENASRIFSLIAAFLFIIRVARSLAAFPQAKARHPELRETSDQVLIYSVLIFPALLPVVVFAHACGMSDELTLFLFNLIAFNFLLVASLAMIASADDISSAVAVEATGAAEVTEAAPVIEQAKPAAVEFSAPHQPKSKKLPPRKPIKVASGVPLPPAPPKPGSSAASAEAVTEASNAPTGFKAPSKPKKRF